MNSDLAYEYIRKRILSGEYPAGHSLATKLLASEIGVSRSPVRDALWQLEADGLVTIRPRLGASVKKLDVKGLKDMCGLRLALETFAAGYAAENRTQADIQEMAYALDAMRTLTDQIIKAPDETALIGDLRKEDVRFHVAIMTAARNDLMKKEILRLHLINRVVGSPPPTPVDPMQDPVEREKRRRKVLRSHEDIFDAIVRGDVRAAKEAMEDHIQDIVDNMLKVMGLTQRPSFVRELTEEEMIYTA